MQFWSQQSKLLERQDEGSELYVEFRELARGPLIDLVRKVVAMAPAERARIIIDAGNEGMLNQAEIIALTGRDDYAG